MQQATQSDDTRDQAVICCSTLLQADQAAQETHNHMKYKQPAVDSAVQSRPKICETPMASPAAALVDNKLHLHTI